MYRLFPEANVVLHVHTVNATVLSRIEKSATLALQGYEMQKTLTGQHSHLDTVPVAIFDNDQNIDALAARSPQSEAIGNARLKTGSLRDVAAIAGYAWGRSGQAYAVVGIVNDPHAGAARPALDRLVEWAIRDQPLE